MVEIAWLVLGLPAAIAAFIVDSQDEGFVHAALLAAIAFLLGPIGLVLLFAGWVRGMR